MGYGIRKIRSRKTRALPSAPNATAKTVYLPNQLRLADSVHFRAPEKWRGKINSKRVRAWFTQFLLGQVVLSGDPGPGALELSVRIPRRALNKVAERLKIPAAVLLRRLIAAQIEPSERTRAAPHILPLLTTAVPVKTARIVPLVKSALQLAAAAASSSITRELKAQEGRKRLRIVSTVGRHRSLGEIGEAMRRSEGITDEELIRWRAVYAGK